MANVLHSTRDQRIVARLKQGWSFLSGEDTEFDLAQDQSAIPPFAEFSFFVPLTLMTRGYLSGLVVMINREAALHVAAHMFGCNKEAVTDEDLKDCSAEVCNVLGDGMRQHFIESQKVGVGLPTRVQCHDYASMCAQGTILQIFQSTLNNHSVKLVLFDKLVLAP